MVEIDWNVENTNVLYKLFAKQVVRGNRPNICFEFGWVSPCFFNFRDYLVVI
jgi:hypothetical protein